MPTRQPSDPLLCPPGTPDRRGETVERAQGQRRGEEPDQGGYQVWDLCRSQQVSLVHVNNGLGSEFDSSLATG
jgi:hypothetical protein